MEMGGKIKRKKITTKKQNLLKFKIAEALDAEGQDFDKYRWKREPPSKGMLEARINLSKSLEAGKVSV